MHALVNNSIVIVASGSATCLITDQHVESPNDGQSNLDLFEGKLEEKIMKPFFVMPLKDDKTINMNLIQLYYSFSVNNPVLFNIQSDHSHPPSLQCHAIFMMN